MPTFIASWIHGRSIWDYLPEVLYLAAYALLSGLFDVANEPRPWQLVIVVVAMLFDVVAIRSKVHAIFARHPTAAPPSLLFGLVFLFRLSILLTLMNNFVPNTLPTLVQFLILAILLGKEVWFWKIISSSPSKGAHIRAVSRAEETLADVMLAVPAAFSMILYVALLAEMPPRIDTAAPWSLFNCWGYLLAYLITAFPYQWHGSYARRKGSAIGVKSTLVTWLVVTVSAHDHVLFNSASH